MHWVQQALALPDTLLEEIAGRFRLLGEPLRLKLLAALGTGERNVGDLVQLTGANQANVSKHLAVLAQAGMVTRRRKGTTIFYRVEDPTIFTLCDIVCTGVRSYYSTRARTVEEDEH